MINTKLKGTLGENIGCSFLEKRKFLIIARNFRRSGGEIDIIAFKDNRLHFFEVKSTTRSHIFEFKDAHRLEDNVHDLKRYRIRKTINKFFSETNRGESTDFSFHVLCVHIDLKNRKSRIKWIRDIVL